MGAHDLVWERGCRRNVKSFLLRAYFYSCRRFDLSQTTFERFSRVVLL